jgi:stress-induced morphogen
MTEDFVESNCLFMSIPKKDLEKILFEAFPNAQIKVVALIDDGDHYSVEIIDKIFAGKTRIEQHKIVNNALKEILGGQLHAMQLKTSSN